MNEDGDNRWKPFRAGLLTHEDKRLEEHNGLLRLSFCHFCLNELGVSEEPNKKQVKQP